MTILLHQNPVACGVHPKTPPSPHRETLEPKHPLPTNSQSPTSPQEQLHTELKNTPMIGLQQMQAHTTPPSMTMKVPGYFPAPHVTPRRDVAEACCSKSAISALQCGSVRPDPYYDPAKDPSIPGNHVICSPPAVISVPLGIAVKIQKAQEPPKKQPQQQPVQAGPKPEWLESPEETKKRLKAEKKAKKAAKKEAKKKKNGGHRRSKSMVSLGTEERETAMKPEIVQRSFSEEDAPTAVRENIKKGHRRTASTPMLNGIVVGPGGRPMYAHQAEAEVEKAAAQAAEEAITPDMGSVNGLMQINYDDHRPRLDSAGDAIDPSTSYIAEDSYHTYTTFYESSLEPQQMQPVSPSPRKGMVRRQLFSKIFRKSNANATEQPETKIKQTSSKDKTAKTVSTSLADWKQSSSSCMV